MDNFANFRYTLGKNRLGKQTLGNFTNGNLTLCIFMAKYQNYHLVLKGSFWFFLVLFYGSFSVFILVLLVYFRMTNI